MVLVVESVSGGGDSLLPSCLEALDGVVGEEEAEEEDGRAVVVEEGAVVEDTVDIEGDIVVDVDEVLEVEEGEALLVEELVVLVGEVVAIGEDLVLARGLIVMVGGGGVDSLTEVVVGWGEVQLGWILLLWIIARLFASVLPTSGPMR